MSPIRRQGFTQLFNGRANVLGSRIGLSEAYDPASGDPQPDIREFGAIWDTGASGSVITPNVVTLLSLQPIDEQLVQTANGQRNANVYLVNFYLPNHVAVSGVRVTDGDLLATDVLIGMDIINMRDFAITNAAGRTCMTFQMPSSRRIDFVKEIDQHNKIAARKEKNPHTRPKKTKRRRN